MQGFKIPGVEFSKPSFLPIFRVARQFPHDFFITVVENGLTVP